MGLSRRGWFAGIVSAVGLTSLGRAAPRPVPVPDPGEWDGSGKPTPAQARRILLANDRDDDRWETALLTVESESCQNAAAIRAGYRSRRHPKTVWRSIRRIVGAVTGICR